MIATILTGALAGILMGYVLQRGQLCFHSAIRNSLDGRFMLARGWALGVALAAVGLALLFMLPGTDALNQGLAFRPVANVTGGLIIGIGMVVAKSCVSGMFYKLGSGMLGALVGLAGWAVGELLARQIVVPGPTVLSGGEGATLPGLLGLPRLVVAGIILVVVLVALSRWPGRESPDRDWQWGWQKIAIGLGVAITAGWALASLGGSSFGPSSSVPSRASRPAPPTIGSSCSSSASWPLRTSPPAGRELSGCAGNSRSAISSSQQVDCSWAPEAGSPAAATSGTGCPAPRSSTCRPSWSSRPWSPVCGSRASCPAECPDDRLLSPSDDSWPPL